MRETGKLDRKGFISSAILLASFLIGLVALPVAGGSAESCQLYRDDDHVKLESLMKSRRFPDVLELGKALYRHYDECEKAASTDAESRVMNRSWRADTAVVIAQVYRRTNRAQEARQWLSGACKDYRVVVEATIVDTTTRKMANEAITKNCRR